MKSRISAYIKPRSNHKTKIFMIVNYMAKDFVSIAEKNGIRFSETPNGDFTQVSLSAMAIDLVAFNKDLDKRKTHYEPVFFYPTMIQHGKNSNS